MAQNRAREMFSNHWPVSARAAATSVLRFFLSIPASIALGCLAQTPTADSLNPGARGAVYVTALQVDGKILLGGDFDLLAGQPCSRLGRLEPDGTLDSGFNSPTTDSYVKTFAMQPDGKILVGGIFTIVGGQAYTHIARLNNDGTLDKGFKSPFLPPHFPEHSLVNSVTVRPNGKIIVNGTSLKIDGITGLWSLVQLNEDGSLDGDFTSGVDGVLSPILLPDGKLLVYQNGGIYRLNPNGTLDESFQGFSQPGVLMFARQPDGKVLVSGSFSAFLGEARTNLVRLNADGTMDAGFNPALTGFVMAMALQLDGKIVLGGMGVTIGGQPANCLWRLNADGTVDSTFNPSAPPSYVDAVAVQSDGKILTGGVFAQFGGEWRTNIGRLNATEPVTESLQCEGGTLTWLRGGGGPECWCVEFQCSSNWVDWTSLGTGTWVAGAWELSGISVPTNSAIRVRGSVAVQAGPTGTASWFIESTTSPPGGPGPLLQFLELRESRLRFQVIGPTATTWRVLRSTDLRSWVQDDTLGTLRLERTQTIFEVPVRNDLAGFYRLVRTGVIGNKQSRVMGYSSGQYVL